MRKRFAVFISLVVLVLTLGYLAGCATAAGQPHMESALSELRSARGELEAATPDKGGHKVRAIELVDEAISEVKAGIAYAAH